MAEIELKNCVDGNEDPDCFYCQNDVQHAKCEKKSKDIEDSTRKRGKPKMKSCKSCFAEIPLVQHFKQFWSTSLFVYVMVIASGTKTVLKARY